MMGMTMAASSSSIVDNCWETLDPCPDIHSLFLQYNDQFFYGRLSGCEVRWSPRMTLCAGQCHYEGRGGLCSIRLSQPLLKLRPRKDLVETLLHEMIHAYLFVTENNRDHDGHGPNFHAHMNRINKAAGSNITVYHSFHAEVAEYKQHWWRCSGPCRNRKPYFGWVKRASNRAPGPNDFWWKDHEQSCGGKYEKIKEPEGYGQKKVKKSNSEKSTKSVKAKGVQSEENVPGTSQKRINDFFGTNPEAKMAKPDSSAISTEEKSKFPGKGHVLGTSVTKETSRSVTLGMPNRATKNVKTAGLLNSPINKNEKINNSKTKTPEVIDLVGNSPTVSMKDQDQSDLVSCPVCLEEIQLTEINNHLDVCVV